LETTLPALNSVNVSRRNGKLLISTQMGTRIEVRIPLPTIEAEARNANLEPSSNNHSL